MVILTENHRQGKDKKFADMLNRICVGKQTQDDVQSLKARVRLAEHPDITSETTKICSTREEASEFNCKRVNELPGQLYTVEARHFCKKRKNYEPLIKKAGKIADTQFEDNLYFKIRGRVMLIYNIAVHDGLCNGAMGAVMAVEEDSKNRVTKIIVKFDNEETGKETRKTNPVFTK